MYDWCLCGGEYSLTAYTDRVTPLFLAAWNSLGSRGRKG